MIAQYTAAAMVASLRHAATPFAVQSAATSAGQEDHVSMGYEAALRTRARSHCYAPCSPSRSSRRPGDRDAPAAPPAPATGAVIAALRTRTSPLGADRILSGDLEAAEAWARDGEWRGALAGAGVTLR